MTRNNKRVEARMSHARSWHYARRGYKFAPPLDKRPKFRRKHEQLAFARADRIGRNLHKFRDPPLPLWLRMFFKTLKSQSTIRE